MAPSVSELDQRRRGGSSSSRRYSWLSLTAFVVWCAVMLAHFATPSSGVSLGLTLLVSAAFAYLLWRLLDAIRRERGASVKMEKLLVSVFENAAVGLALMGANEHFENVNQAYCDIVGYTREEILAPSFCYETISLPEEYPIVTANARSLMQADDDGSTREVTRRYVHKSGRLVWVNVHVYLYRPGPSGPRSFVLAVVDVTQQKAAELAIEQHQQHLEALISERTTELEASNAQLQGEVAAHRRALQELETSEKRFRFITENTGDVLWTLDLTSGLCTYVSPSIAQLGGYAPDEYVGQPLESFLPEEACQKLLATIAKAVAEWEPGAEASALNVIELDRNHRDGHVIHTEVVLRLHADASGKPNYVLGVTRDITERRRSDAAIRQLAYIDSLTQLPNRRMLSDRLEQAIARAKREGYLVALLFMDLDNFKPVNDAFGHEVGDWLLQSVAGRISDCLRPYDTAARMGGDEFVVLLPDLNATDESVAIAERLRLSLQTPFVTPDGRRIQVSSSIGIALYPNHARTERDLLRVGDEAMFRAKKNGRNNVFLLASDVPRNFTPIHVPKRGASLVRLNWSSAYCSGDPAIDVEHRNLFKLANSVLDQCAGPNADPKQVQPALQRLVAHIEQHFSEEEALMQQWGYSKVREHAEVHEQLLQRANEFRQGVERHALPLGEFVEFVAVDVVAKHMLKYDRDYFSVAKGPESRAEPSQRSREEPSRPGFIGS
jgi:diguanylate cyclase (GGDEF)-like protein/hemerythrin-like metal-binding protein/PAS domain S-box-containing protein